MSTIAEATAQAAGVDTRAWKYLRAEKTRYGVSLFFVGNKRIAAVRGRQLVIHPNKKNPGRPLVHVG